MSLKGLLPLQRFLRLLLFWLALSFAVLVHADVTAQPTGHLDKLSYIPALQELHLEGWAWDRASNQPANSLRVMVGNQHYVMDILSRTERADVRNTLHPSATDAGFVISHVLSASLSEGFHSVEITALWSNGTTLQLATPQAGQLHVHAGSPPTRHWILLALLIGWIALAYIPRIGTYGGHIDSWVARRTKWIGIFLILLFALLVSAGVTGSSWLLLAQGIESELVRFQGGQSHVFEPLYIRADEWGILTTNALAQWNHQPPFPIVNTNLGPEGQNMGVVGMTGTPVAQWAAVARPATWGYFFLPLRQAMAWHWQFPFFACLFVLWKTLGLLLPARPTFNLVLATTFCVAPYAAGWSLWPLYAAFFPLALFLALVALIQTCRLDSALLWGVAGGVLLAGWVMVLYPPWQITVGTFMGFLALGWAADNRERLQWQKAQWLGLALALVLTAALLLSWWLDTGDAVARMRATVYPGGRTALQGAEIDNTPWWTLRGYLNIEALPFGLGANAQTLAPSVHVNQSEISSYILLPLPLLLLAIWRSMQSQNNRWTLLFCTLFVAFWLVFRFFGVPLWLAKLTLWSHVTSIRLDLVIGLASTIMLALVRTAGFPEHHGASKLLREIKQRLVPGGVALATAGLVFFEFASAPQGLLPSDSAPLRISMALALGWCAWWVMRAHIGRAAGLLLLLSAGATLSFNPWSIAPQSVELRPEVRGMASDQGQMLRTLVISNDAKAAATLVAAGVPVVNSVLYYPQPNLWKGMGLAAEEWDKVNRYQHLTFSLAEIPPPSPPFRVRGDMDSVRVHIDPRRFDFSSTGAKRVVAYGDAALWLRKKSYLRELGEVGGFVWFDARPNIAE